MSEEKKNFVINEELLKIWMSNPLMSVAADAWGHAVLTALSTSFPDRLNKEKTVLLDESKNQKLNSNVLAVIRLENFLSPTQWANGSDFVDGLVWTIERKLDKETVVQGSLRIKSEIFTEDNSDNFVRLTLIYITQ